MSADAVEVLNSANREVVLKSHNRVFGKDESGDAATREMTIGWGGGSKVLRGEGALQFLGGELGEEDSETLLEDYPLP